MLFTCPRTGKEVKIPVDVMGRSFECPSCGQMHLAPVPQTPRTEAPGNDEAGVFGAQPAGSPGQEDGGIQSAPAAEVESPTREAAAPESEAAPQPPSPVEPPAEAPTETATEAPPVTPTEKAIDTPAETPAEASTEKAIDAPAEALAEALPEAPAETPPQPPAEASAEAPAEAPPGSRDDGPPAPPQESASDAPPPSPDVDADIRAESSRGSVPVPALAPAPEAPLSPLAPPPETSAAVAEEEAAPQDEHEDSVPTPAAGFATPEPQAPAPPPAPSRRTGRLVALTVILAAVGAGGYFGWVQVQRSRARRDFMHARRAVFARLAEQDFAGAAETALRAEAIMARNPGAFPEPQAGLAANVMARAKRALEVITLARDAAGRSGSTLDAKLAELDRLTSEAAASKYGFLELAVADLRTQCVLDEAARIAGAETGDAAGIDRAILKLNALKRRVESEEDAVRFDEAVAKFLSREKERALVAARAGAKEAVWLFADGKADAALKRAAKVEADVAELPREIGGGAFLEYLADTTNVAQAKAGESSERLGVAEGNAAAAAQLFTLRAILREATDVCETGASDIKAAREKLGELRDEALEVKGPSSEAPSLAGDAVRALDQEVGRIRSAYGEAHRADEEDGGAFLKASIIRIAMSSPRVRFRAKGIEQKPGRFRAEFRLDGVPAALHAGKDTHGGSALITVDGYTFIIPWEHFMYRSVFLAGALARRMRAAGVEPVPSGHWEMVEGPSSPVALRWENRARARCVVEGEVGQARAEAGADRGAIDEFTKAARELRASIKADESIQSDLRQALDATLAATFGETDPRDWLDPAFCRRIVAEGYLERNIPELAQTHRDILTRYRSAYQKLAAGYPVLSITRRDGRTLTAFGSLEDELSPHEPGVYERQTYSWRVASAGGKETLFAVPLPDRNAHPLYVAATFEGDHESQPASAEPVRLEMLHALAGSLASKKPGASTPDGSQPGTWELEFDQERWDETLDADSGLFRNETYGTPGWALPPHVPVLDSAGTPKAILTRRGLLASPDFGAIADAEARRAAEAKYLDECAEKLKTPGELNFLFKYFTRYVLDSPVASKPNVLGSHIAMGETHQTAEQFLERKIGGYFVGDCDDVAEFFQVITRRQDKLSHVFSLPRHAACGYVEEREPKKGEDFEFIFLQTGPPRIFKAPTLDEVVEKGVMAFSEDEDQSFTVASVAFLFRFANEQTRTPYVLSDRIIVDKEYAKIMIRVQSYWHYHYYATAFRTMEALLEKDKDISNFTELAGLYRFVGLYEKSVEMSRAGLAAMKRSDEKIRQKELLDIATMHRMAGDDLEVRKVLLKIMEQTAADIKARNFRQVFRLMPIRFMGAGLYAMIGDPLAGFRLVQMDIRFSQRGYGKIIDPLRRSLVGLYVSFCQKQRREGKLSEEEESVRGFLSQLLLEDFSKDLFEEDDGFNSFLRNYTQIGSFAVATVGREKAREMLLADGPYPDGKRKHAERGAEITPDDWEWFRICPPLYMQLAGELANPPSGPHRWLPASRAKEMQPYDPALAIRLIEAMLRGAEAGRKLGSMNAMEGLLLRGRMLRVILRSDLEGFDRLLAEVKSKDWDRHFEDASSGFGDLMGLLRLEDVPAWMDVFHKYVPGKQHYFRIAYWALDDGYLDHGLAAAECAVKFFPEETAMAGELLYMRDLVKQLKVLAAERAKRQAPGGVTE
ncbi:MAG: hypothetical protein ACYS9X_16060 [Planctomycetota bacterium]|jgi:hypothetical protein